MLKLLLLVALQHSLICCISIEFAGPVLTRLRVPAEHIVQKRQVRVRREHFMVDDQDNFNTFAPVKPQVRDLFSKPQLYKKINDKTDEINGDQLQLPSGYFKSEDQNDDLLPPNINTKTDVDIPSDPFFDIDFIEILNDLATCIELNRVHTLRLCPIKKENHKIKHISQFDNLTNEELESEIEKKCKTFNRILEKSAKEFKDSLKKKMANSDRNDSNVNTSDESLKDLSDDQVPSNKTPIVKLIPVPPEYNLQDDDIIIDDKQSEELEEPFVQSKANIETSEYTDNAFLADVAEQTNKTYLDSASQDILDPSRSFEYDTIENINQIGLKNALSELFSPISELIGENSTTEDMPYSTKTITDNTEKLPFINGRRNYLRPTVNENEVPVIKIITHEYPGGNVVSKVNGTEILINASPSEENYTNVFVKNIKVQDNNNVSEVLYKFYIPKHIPDKVEFDHEIRTQEYPKESFIGRLYLIHKNVKIPAQFIQEVDGNISVGLDILSICKTEKLDSNSVLFKRLCRCKNCSSEIN